MFNPYQNRGAPLHKSAPEEFLKNRETGEEGPANHEEHHSVPELVGEETASKGTDRRSDVEGEAEDAH